MDSPQLSQLSPVLSFYLDQVILFGQFLYLFFKNEQVSINSFIEGEEFKIYSTMPGAYWHFCSVHLYALFGSLFLDSI